MSDIVEMDVDSSTVALLNKSEIDQQIATAHKYPRSIKRFRDETLQMVTLNETIAQECIYALPRDGKTIEGPSARFAEVVASAWGNSRAGARVVNDQGEFVTAQGVFHDLERNVAITYEVQRRVTNKQGKRFSADMISVTANAACSIALRNAILKGVPKAFWADMYDAARQTAIGNSQTLANRRARALAVLQKYGVMSETVFAFLGVEGEQDITIDHLTTLFGITTAIKEGETTAEQAFATPMNGGPAPVQQPQSKSQAPQTKPDADGVLTQYVQREAEPVQQNEPPVQQSQPEMPGMQQSEPTAQQKPRAAAKRKAADADEQFEEAPRTLVSESVLRVLKAKMEGAALGEADLRKKFGYGYDGVTTSNYNTVVAWIEDPMGGE